MQPLAQEVSKEPVAGSLEHVPGKGLLSPWPVAYAPFTYASAAGHYQGQDIGLSGPLIWPGKIVFTFFVVLGIGTDKNSCLKLFSEEVSNLHVDFSGLWQWPQTGCLCTGRLIWYLSWKDINWDCVVTLQSCDVTNANYPARFISFQGRKKKLTRKRDDQRKAKSAFFPSSSMEVVLKARIKSCYISQPLHYTDD